MDTHEYAALRLGVVDEFKPLSTDELLKQGKRGSGALKFGILWTAEVYVVRGKDFTELLGNKGTKVQKLIQ